MLSAQELTSVSFQNLEMETKLLTLIYQSLCCSGLIKPSLTEVGWLQWVVVLGSGTEFIVCFSQCDLKFPISSEECLGKSPGFASLAARFWP